MTTLRRTLSLCLVLATLSYASFSRSGTAQQKAQGGDTATGAKKPAPVKSPVAQSTDDDKYLPVVMDDKFTIEVTSKTDNVAGGQPIQVDITLKNNGTSKTKLFDSPVENFFDIEVTGPYLGNPTSRLPSADFRRHFVSSSLFELSNGRTISGWVMLSNIYDMTLKGTYTVRVSKRFRFLDARKAPVVIRSNPLTIEVPRDAPISSWYSAEEKH